ncbi:hypothetical protein ZWY2020_034136 [Hordeum vulgare]|nr:hypothetical protein ZWY2020_034136 [Hordeum vulgare]
MAHYAAGSSSDASGAPESNWTLRLDTPVTEELHRYELLVPPGCRLVKPWKVSKDGFATMGPPATAEELRNHRDGLYNVRGRHAFWDGKSYNIIAKAPAPGKAATRRIQRPPRRHRQSPPLRRPAEFELLLEQFVLREDGDLTTIGLLVASRASQRLPGGRGGGGIAGDPAANKAMANPQPVVGDSNDDIDWDNLANSSDDDNGVGRDGAVKGPGVIYLESTIRLVFSF